MHARLVSGVVLAAILIFSIASIAGIAVGAKPASAQAQTRGQSWSTMNSLIGEAEETFETDPSGALSKVDEAEAIYESAFRSAAFEVDQATGENMDNAFADIRTAINDGNELDVIVNKQWIDKLTYKIAFMKIEQSLDEASSSLLRDSMIEEAADWYTVMTTKFNYDENPSDSSEAMAALQAEPDRLQELTPVIMDGLKSQFLLKVREEVIEAIGALEMDPPDTLNAQKFAIEGIAYYLPIQPDVATEIGSEDEAELFHELEELFEAAGAADLETAEHVAVEISALLDAYEGKESSGVGAALNTMNDMLTLVDVEYGDAVADGQIIDQAEYDESLLFLERATDAFEGAKDDMMAIAAHETEEIEQDLATLADLIQDMADPAEVSAVVEHSLAEIEVIQEAAGSNTDFAANIEFIRGHLEKAVENKNADRTDLAVAHASHPVEEVYSLVTVPLSAADPELDEELESALVALANDIDTMSGSQVQTAVDDINSLLDKALTEVAGDETTDHAFNAMVMVLLLQTAEVEYGEAIEDGQVIEEIEYQDASAFMHRAMVVFENVKSGMPEHEAEEVEEFFEELNSSVSSNAEPSLVSTVLNGIIHELDEVFSLGVEGSEELDGWGYIDHIHELLDQTIEAYRAGNAAEARALAIEAYLDNYEFIEADIAEEDRELMEKIEVDMRVELVEMIDGDRPVAEVESHIEQIKTDLETARAVVTPEFPVAALAAAISLGGAIAYTRFRTSFGRRA